jgi:hypothetical protein
VNFVSVRGILEAEGEPSLGYAAGMSDFDRAQLFAVELQPLVGEAILEVIGPTELGADYVITVVYGGSSFVVALNMVGMMIEDWGLRGLITY